VTLSRQTRAKKRSQPKREETPLLQVESGVQIEECPGSVDALRGRTTGVRLMPSENPTERCCRDCGASITAKSKTGRCSRCAMAAVGRANARPPVTRICAGCGEEFTRPAGTPRTCCSWECHLEHREVPRGADHWSWKGDEVGYWGRYRRAQKAVAAEPCEVCGEVNADRHHRNRNTLDNRPENIAFLCRSHHSALHYREDGPKGAVA